MLFTERSAPAAAPLQMQPSGSRRRNSVAKGKLPRRADADPLRRVLLVEDDYLAATEAEAALLDAGFEVIGPAGSAAEAIALASTERPALAVMDVRLAGARDGIDAACELYRDLGIRSIFATAHSTPEIRDRAADAAPLAWLAKPYAPPMLVAEVRAALEKLKS